MQPHGDIRGQVEPDRDLLLDPRRRVALRELVEQPLAAQEREQVALQDLADHLDRIELAAAERLEHAFLVALEEGGSGGSWRHEPTSPGPVVGRAR